MRVWLYYRLSRDEDKELNSLTNQKKILEDYCNAQGYAIVGESFDDNVSGMHFDRDGIEKIYEEVEKKSIDAVVVKDLSRLGRHKTQTAIFIDYLRQHDIRVLSVTENIDTSNEDDEMLKKCEDDITTLTEQLDSIRNYEATIKKRKAEIKEGIDMLDEIVAAGAVSDAHLRMLVEEIVINEKKGKLKIKIKMRAKFSSHIDFIPNENDPMYQNMSPYLIQV